MDGAARGLLVTLQHADSFFPGGGIAFSWGVESLVADGLLPAHRLGEFLLGQLQQRWAVYDRCALAAAFGCGTDLDAVAQVDLQIEAMSLARELREGSKRAGSTLIAVHERLATPGAAQYRAAIQSHHVPGHLCVIQGLVWNAAGLTLPQAEAAAAHGFCISLLGAVLRLGAAGHLQAQQALLAVRPALSDILEAPASCLGECHSFAPMTEIAAMRHEVYPSRLFAN